MTSSATTKRIQAPPPPISSHAGAVGSPYVRLIRPRQWIKNGFVLAPALFAGVFTDGGAVLRAFAAAILFCLTASAIYVLNDLADAPRDRQHAAKRLARPIASGAVSPRAAVLLIASLLSLVAAGCVWLLPVALPLSAYVVLNAAYSYRLKHIPVVDLFCVATGFVLRVWAGARAVDVPLSSWMLITTMALALYLAAVKRRQELSINGPDGRVVLRSYSVSLLDQYAQTASIASVVFYALYVIDVRPELVVSIPFVLFGVFRYWYMVQTLSQGESPTEALWGDRPLIVTILAWVGSCMYALWP